MIKRLGWAVIVTCSLMCSQAQASKLQGWEMFRGYAGMRGLRLKPIEVVFARRGVMLNHQSTTVEGAFRLLEKSHNLTPLPDILVRADRGRSLAARRFMKRVGDAGMCEDRMCLYRFNR